MEHWPMTQEPPAGFTADRETELKAADESKAIVRYARRPLDIDCVLIEPSSFIAVITIFTGASSRFCLGRLLFLQLD